MSKVIPIPGCSVELSEGEEVVRCYYITDNKRPKARGDVAVTNKRVIYQGKGKNGSAVTEVPIEGISAINTYCGSGFKVGRVIIGLLFIAAGIYTLDTIIISIIGFLIGIYYLFTSFNLGYSLSIKTSAAMSTGISVGASDITSSSGFISRLFATSGQCAALSLNAVPTAEALQMMNELGAIVMDLKTMGDSAIEKWKNFQPAPVDTSVLSAKLTAPTGRKDDEGKSAPVISHQSTQSTQHVVPSSTSPQTESQAQRMPAPPPPPSVGKTEMAPRPTAVSESKTPPPPVAVDASRKAPPPPPAPINLSETEPMTLSIPVGTFQKKVAPPPPPPVGNNEVPPSDTVGASKTPPPPPPASIGASLKYAMPTPATVGASKKAPPPPPPPKG